MIPYPKLNDSLSFSAYTDACELLIRERRAAGTSMNVITANMPFDYKPTAPTKIGVLLVHGLLDSPFSMRDIAQRLQENNIHSRAILLPGHGTQAKDLLSVTHQDWAQAVNWGVKSFADEVEKIFLIGYSTGAALSLQQALKNPRIAGVVMLAPAIKIKISAALIIAWHFILHTLMNDRDWLYKHPDIDYTKYLSICYNSVDQVQKLTNEIKSSAANLTCPTLTFISEDDETISATNALDFFQAQKHEGRKLILYSTKKPGFSDPKIIVRNSHYPELAIKNFSHVALPFKPDNAHYGQHGDYERASHLLARDRRYGAHSYPFVQLWKFLYHCRLASHRRCELTYNPDFEFMIKTIVDFIANAK